MCEKCGLVTSTKYSMKRHIERKHGHSENMEEERESTITVVEETNTIIDVSMNPPANELKNILEYAGLGTYLSLFV